MTSQSLKRRARLRRAAFFGLTFLTSGLASFLMLDILRANGLSVLERIGLVLFFFLFTWIAGAFWTAVAGFIIRLVGRDPVVIHPDEVRDVALRSRIALVMPVYNEDTSRVMAGLAAIWESLATQADAKCFDLFILSDTRKPEIAALEEIAWRALVARHQAEGRIFYRRRAQNVGRKAGNIADFVRTWGAAYEYMVVLDADSVMTGYALVMLGRLMDAHPEVGIMQTAPLPVGRETLFARIIQFGARLNGPMLSSGLAFWQLGDSNYWAHNAILRLRPFASACGLPRLPGAAPLGGEILSHDFVEAAFMRRAGFEVWLLPDLDGSWEELPSNIIDFAARDRRWAQGNLQHCSVMPLHGLRWLSRLHMLTGVLSYVTSPMWFAVLIVSSIITIQDALAVHQYFQPGAYTLFPTWPEYRDGEIAALLGVTILVLLLPKLLGASLALFNRSLRKGFGGGGRLMLSLLLEQLFSMLLAPPMMLFHTTFVVSTLAGKPVVWNAQERGDRGVTLRDALARHVWHMLVGLVWGALILLLAPRYLWWMLPVIAGLLLSAPLSILSSRADLGRLARRGGLFLTPEEVTPPPELAALHLLGSQTAESLLLPAPTGGDGDDHLEPQAVPAPAPLAMEPTQPVYWGMRTTVDTVQQAAASAARGLEPPSSVSS
ncbi:MAG TPA: glucans biosynthesis glucosyltransferase MdoH [Steroidobacteraceae bacterium]|nr:glucans biosynthesis glucosyltransferase MdoH [Steroidobacteraceae bacterium]